MKGEKMDKLNWQEPENGVNVETAIDPEGGYLYLRTNLRLEGAHFERKKGGTGINIAQFGSAFGGARMEGAAINVMLNVTKQGALAGKDPIGAHVPAPAKAKPTLTSVAPANPGRTLSPAERAQAIQATKVRKV